MWSAEVRRSKWWSKAKRGGVSWKDRDAISLLSLNRRVVHTRGPLRCPVSLLSLSLSLSPLSLSILEQSGVDVRSKPYGNPLQFPSLCAPSF